MDRLSVPNTILNVPQSEKKKEKLINFICKEY